MRSKNAGVELKPFVNLPPSQYKEDSRSHSQSPKQNSGVDQIKPKNLFGGAPRLSFTRPSQTPQKKSLPSKQGLFGQQFLQSFVLGQQSSSENNIPEPKNDDDSMESPTKEDGGQSSSKK